MATEYGSRLREARRRAGLTQVQLAAITGIAQSTISSAERSGQGSADTVIYARACGVDPTWLATGEGSITVSTETEVSSSIAAMRWVPVVGQAKVGADGHLEDHLFAVSHGGYVEFWAKDAKAYALRVRGDTLHPRYRAGEFIVVTPGTGVQPGQDVVVKLKTGKRLLRQLNWVRGEEIQLLNVAGDFSPTTLGEDEFDSVHRVAGNLPADSFHVERASK